MKEQVIIDLTHNKGAVAAASQSKATTSRWPVVPNPFEMASVVVSESHTINRYQDGPHTIHCHSCAVEERLRLSTDETSLAIDLVVIQTRHHEDSSERE